MSRQLPTREEIERLLPHDMWCDEYGEHQDCCPGRAEWGCHCTASESIDILIAHGWLKVAD